MKTTLFSVLIFLAFNVYAQNKSEPYDFKGYKLGMSLVEFKAKAAPETSDFIPSNNHDVTVPSRPICSDTQRTGMSVYSFVDEAEKKHHGVVCEFAFEIIKNAYSSYQSSTLKQSSLTLSGATTTKHSFRFIQTENNPEPILYQISMHFGSNGFMNVSTALSEKFGKSRIVNETVQNRMGATFNNQIQHWENPVSHLMLQKFFGDTETSLIVYSLKKEATLIRKTREQINKKPM